MKWNSLAVFWSSVPEANRRTKALWEMEIMNEVGGKK
jgi:hypothetical protein